MSDPIRHQRVCDLVNEALDHDREARARFLDSACAGDVDLRAEVESLLREEAALDAGFLAGSAIQILSSPSAETVSLTGQPPDLPDVIGPFRILRLLGEGGMGRVLLAEQSQPFQRKLALKLIRGLLAPQDRRRFIAECQAMARLNHPNVASLYEAGTIQDPHLGSLPYVAMEWIDGEMITDWCDRRQLRIEDRLALFQGACAGVQHAHEKGILHRDLKPGNVLVTEIDGRPVAKIIDFGIAFTLDGGSEGETGLGTRIGFAGSPAYLSPEAAATGSALDLDTRSDVYSLGLLLFELLIGVRPFESRDLGVWSQLQRLREEDPPTMTRRWADLPATESIDLAAKRGLTPIQLVRRIRGDLDAIVGKALERDRTRRYVSPAALAEDLQRHLFCRPILARPPSFAYVAVRLIRRRWRTALTAGLLILALIGGFVARSIEARRAQREAVRAKAALAENQQLSEFLIDLFRVADPDRRKGAALTVREMLDRGVELLPARLPEQPLARARFIHTIGMIYNSLGLFEKAESLFRQALDIRRQLLPENDPAILDSFNQLGIVLREMDRFEEGQYYLERALDILEQSPAPDPVLLASTHSHLGNLLWAMRCYRESEIHHRRALELRRADSEDFLALAESLNNLAVALRFQGEYWEAQELLSEAHQTWESYLGSTHPRTTAALFNTAKIAHYLGHFDQAIDVFRRSLEYWETAYGPRHPRSIFARSALFQQYLDCLMWCEAAEAGARYLALLDSLNTDYSQLKKPLRSYGLALAQCGNYELARVQWERLYELDKNQIGLDGLDTLIEAGNLAWLIWQSGDLDKGFEEMGAVLKRALPILGQKHQNIAWIQLQMGKMEAQRLRLNEAEHWMRQALGNHEGLGDPHSLELADTLSDLGRLLALTDREEEGRSYMRRAMAIRRVRLPPGHPLVQATFDGPSHEKNRGELNSPELDPEP